MSARTPAEWAVLVAASIARGQQEIAADMESGRVPADVADFATLHDYVDANEYGGLCEEGWLQYEDGEWTVGTEQAANDVQGGLHQWLQQRHNKKAGTVAAVPAITRGNE